MENLLLCVARLTGIALVSLDLSSMQFPIAGFRKSRLALGLLCRLGVCFQKIFQRIRLYHLMLKMKATTSLVRLVSIYQNSRHIQERSNLVTGMVCKLFCFILKTWHKQQCIHISYTHTVGDMVCC